MTSRAEVASALSGTAENIGREVEILKPIRRK
jgi:hypothetical protein